MPDVPVRSFTMDDGFSLRVFYLGTVSSAELGEKVEAHAIFCKLAANRDDEWALYGLSFNLDVSEVDDALRHIYEKQTEEAGGDVSWLLRRNIAFGTTIGKIADDPKKWATMMDQVFGVIPEVLMELTKQMPVETVRQVRDQRRGESE